MKSYARLGESRCATGQLGTLLRESGQSLFSLILAAESARFLEGFSNMQDEFGRDAVVRNGYQPARQIETGIGPIVVRVPKVRSRTGEVAVFRSAIVPRYLRRTRPATRESVWRYLYGIWTCDLNHALVALLGARAAHLAGAVPESARSAWTVECRGWRVAPADDVVEVWAEAIMPDPALGLGSIFVVIGSDSAGKLILLSIDHGRGDAQRRWATIAIDLAGRGLQRPERIHAGGWAVAFSNALRVHAPAQTPELTATGS